MPNGKRVYTDLNCLEQYTYWTYTAGHRGVAALIYLQGEVHNKVRELCWTGDFNYASALIRLIELNSTSELLARGGFSRPGSGFGGHGSGPPPAGSAETRALRREVSALAQQVNRAKVPRFPDGGKGGGGNIGRGGGGYSGEYRGGGHNGGHGGGGHGGGHDGGGNRYAPATRVHFGPSAGKGGKGGRH